MLLIVNADDFGLSRGVNYGIVDSFKNGIVTSTTLLVNAERTMDAVNMIKEYSFLNVGLHLALTMTKPLTDCKEFLNEKGYFKSRKEYNQDFTINQDLLYEEWDAQVKKFIELTNRMPTHMDSHHHFYLHKGCTEVIKTLSKKYDLPVRDVETAFQTVTLKKDFYDETVDIDYFENLLKQDFDCIELMVHPGFLDAEIERITSYSKKRIYEHEILTSAKIKKMIEKNNVQLVSYKDVKKRSVGVC